MCMAVVGVIGALASVAGGVIQGQANAQRLDAQAKAAERRAEQAERQAIIETDVGGIEADRARRRGTVMIAQSVNAFAAGGLDPSGGSNAAVIASSAQELDLDVQAIAFDAELRSDNQRFNAEQERFQASEFRAAKSSAFLAPVIGGVASGASRLATVFD